MLMFKRKKKIDIDSIPVKLNISNPNIIKTIKMLGLSKKDLQYLKNIYPIIETNIDSIIENFYKALSQEKDLTDIINQHSSVNRLKGALSTHVLEMFEGNLDDTYINKREKIAKIHLRIGLSSTAYCFAFDSLSKDIYKLIYDTVQDNDDKLNTTLALVKIFNLEQNTTLNAYDLYAKEQQESIENEKTKLKLAVVNESSNLAAVSEEVFASYQQLQEQTKNVLAYAHKAKLLSDNVELKASDGELAIMKQVNSMNDMTSSVNKISKDIERVNDVANKVNNVLSVIKDIADQTNLLALNASIQASHAKEHGKGFNVIAYEVRKLSQETKMSLQGVNDLLATVNNEANLLKNSIQSIVESVEENEKSLNETKLKFVEITESSTENQNQSALIENEMTQLENVIKELNSAFNEVANSADSLSSISQSLLE